MIVAVPGDPGRSYALAAYWPGPPPLHWNWAAGQWQAQFVAADCLRQFAADPASPLGDLLVARLPPVLAAPPAEIVLQLISLGPAGEPVETVDCEVLSAGE